jgi:N12 class adenine-specific DNA methylase
MRVLAMSAEDFAQSKRGTFLSRIATEEWDAIICGHSSLGLIEMGSAGDAFVEQELARLEAHLHDAREQAKQQGSRASTRSVKAIEKRVAQLETKLQRTASGIARDRGVIQWEELGIDAIIVDESHLFKNLGVVSQMGAIPGIPTGNAARAFDLRMKTWDIRRRGGRVVLMTATPILNTLGEVFIFQTFLQDDVLEQHGLGSFDAWAATFAETETLLELAPDGSGFRTTTRLCRFVNLPELFSLWFRVTFARSKEQLSLPVPAIVGGKPLAVSVPGSPQLRALTAAFAARAERIKTGQVDPSVDNMLTVVGDGRKAALDVHMLGLPADAINKIGVLADHVARLYHDYDDARATQIIFCELGTPPR